MSINEFSIRGKSGKVYEFRIYPLSYEMAQSEDELDNYGMLYIYLNQSTSGIRFIYCGKDSNPPSRLKYHKLNDENIINKSNGIAICYYMYKNDLDNAEIDILEGNDFEENIQHNS